MNKYTVTILRPLAFCPWALSLNSEFFYSSFPFLRERRLHQINHGIFMDIKFTHNIGGDQWRVGSIAPEQIGASTNSSTANFGLGLRGTEGKRCI